MFWRRKRPLDDFTEELRSHIGLEADQLRESGGHSDSETAARRAFGNITTVQESFYERGRWLAWDTLVRDLRHGLRLMRRNPGFSVVVVLTLALGIGANTAIFSLIDAVLLRPLPYKNPGRLAMLWTEDPTTDDREGRVSLLDAHDWKTRSHSFQDMTVFIGQTFLLGSDGSPERLRSARVPANFFPLLGVEPLQGRVFTADEEKRGESVVVLSHAFWQREFAGSEHIVGSDLVMDGRKSRIIGIMPPRFQFPFQDTQVWEPLTAHPYWAQDRNRPRSAANWYVLGRIRPNIGWPQAQAEMDAIARRIRAEYGSQAPSGIRVVPLYTQTTRKVQLSLSVLFASVFLMLLIACINVANLLLARGSAREREFAVRRALGAGRMQLVGLLLAESFVLSAAGGLLGLLLAAAGLKALIAFGPQNIPRLAEARIDPRVLIFTLAISLFSAIVAGLWPAAHSSTRLAGSRQWTTVASRRMRSLLVAGEFSLALMLVAGAGLLVHSFLRLQTVDPGFRPGNLLVMHIDLHRGKTPAQRVAYFREAIERAQSLPGVRSAAAIGRFLNAYSADPVAIEGRPSGPGFQATDVLISGPYFQTAGIPLKKGRLFTALDREDSLPVAIVNQKMAERFWPAADPIGKRFRFSDQPAGPWFTVVGVTGDMHREGIEKDVAPQVFRPHAQDADNEMDVLVRTASNPLAMAETVRDALQAIDKSVPKFGVTTVDHQLAEQTVERRFHTTLMGIFSLVALLLSAIGIYGLMHYIVIQRSNEIGVRMALGARYANVLALVMRQGMLLAGMGVAAGIGGALALTRLLASLLYGVTPTDPVSFAIAPAILLAVAAMACWLPARRAAHIDPVRALRQD